MATSHLLSTHDLSREDITSILDDAAAILPSHASLRQVDPVLAGRNIVLAFLEPSTRTRLSFETAAQRLGASTIVFHATGSSVEKGETLRESLRTIESMGFDALVLRHGQNGVHRDVAQWSSMSVINAGEGTVQHPTQALLDASTLREHFGAIDGRKVAIVGDLRHSRVARSTADVLQKCGAHIGYCAPDELVPTDPQFAKMQRLDSIQDCCDWADAVYLLRIQRERLAADVTINDAEYRSRYAMKVDLARAHRELVVLHPGPVNIGMELDGEILDDPMCLIHRQVTHGVAVRMAVLQRLLHS
jgi:aspartate carbamoyltransferase catalytic subunit